MSRTREYYKVISCRITKEEYDRMEKVLEKENLTMSEKMRKLIEEYLKEES